MYKLFFSTKLGDLWYLLDDPATKASLFCFSFLPFSWLHRERESAFSRQRWTLRVSAVRPENPEQPPGVRVFKPFPLRR